MERVIMTSSGTSVSQYGSMDEFPKSTTTKSPLYSHSLPDGESSICGVLGNFLNAMIGAGILAIPYVYAQVGLVGGISLMIVFALLCTYTLNLLVKAAQNFKVSEYEELGSKSFGTIGYIASSVCLFIMDFGSIVNYLIIIGDAAFKVLQIWGFDAFYYREVVIIAVSMIIIFPPCLLRDISFYEKWSALKLFAIGLVIVIVIYQYIVLRILNSNNTQMISDIVWFDVNGMGAAMGIVAYCFVAHDTAFIYYNTLWNPTTTRWSSLSLLAIVCAMLVSVSLSIPAYFTFGINVESNILNNYAVNDPSIIFTRCVYVITMALTYPTAFFVVRHVVCAWVRQIIAHIKIRKYRKENVGKKELESDIQIYAQQLYEAQYTVKTAPLWQHLVYTCSIFFVSLVIALLIDNLGLAMGVIGCLSSVNLAFVLPCLCYIKSVPYGFLSCITETKMTNKIAALFAIYPPLLIALFGVFVVIYSLMTINN